MDAAGRWPIHVNPQEYLVGPPPAMNLSGVTIPVDHWIELKFPGKIVDGPGDDIVLVELDQMGEQAMIFLTDGISDGIHNAGTHEYLLGLASVPMAGQKADSDRIRHCQSSCAVHAKSSKNSWYRPAWRLPRI